MGKGQRSRLARADEMAAKKVAAKKKEKQDKIIKFTSITAAIVMVVALVGMIAWFTINDTNRNNGTYLKNDIAVESANYKISNAQQMYFFQNFYASFVENNADYMSYYGLDQEKSLKEQTCPYTNENGESMSWYDYFMDATTAQVEQTLVLAEAAKEAGVTLSEEDNKQIADTVSKIAPENFAPGLTEDEIRECLELSLIASNYQLKIQDAIEYTDADLEKYYTDHKNNFDTVDYRMYSFAYAAEGDAEAESKMSRDEAKKLADELAATGNEQAYIAWLSKYFTDTQGVAAKDLESELNNTKTEDFAYSESYVGIDFLFGTNTKAGDIKVVEDEENSMFKVFLLLSPRSRDESTTKSVRHILISVEDATDEAAKKAAKAKADKLLADWAAGEATEQSFAALVHDNTDDQGSKETGGLYENFGRGEMVESFENWSYDEARKPGDTGVVETDYGYHVMYFVGHGETAWKKTAESSFVSDEYSKQYTAFAEKYIVTVNDKKIENIASYIK